MNQSFRVYAYLRASTDHQDASRAEKTLDKFASEHGLTIAAKFKENQSGTKLERDELKRMLDIAQSGDVLLIEQVDRLTRLTLKDWEVLKATIKSKELRIVTLDIPTTWEVLKDLNSDLLKVIMSNINGMLFDILAVVARKDYEDRRRRIEEGIQKAKAQGKYKGRPIDTAKRDKVLTAFNAGMTKNQIFKVTGIARTTINRILEEVSE